MKNEHVFAIGDVHGRADLLGPLLASIEDRAAEMDVEFLSGVPGLIGRRAQSWFSETTIGFP